MEYQKIIYSRLLISFFWTIVLHIIPVSLYVLLGHFDLSHPFDWFLRSTSQIFSVRTWLYTMPLHVFVFALGLIILKEHSSPPVMSVSRFDGFYNAFSKNCMMKAFLYVALGTLLPFIYAKISNDSLSYLTSDHPNTTVLNERVVFLITCGLWTGLYYFVRYDANSDKPIQFPVVQQIKFLQLRCQLFGTIVDSFRLSVTPVFYFILVYYWIGNWVCSIFQAVMKVQLASSLTSISGLFNIPLFVNAWIISSVYIVVIKTLLLLMQIHLYEHYSFPLIKQNKAEISLSTALSLQNVPIIQYLAFYELFLIAMNKKSLRLQIFALSQPGGHPHTWNGILYESMKIMNCFIGQVEDVFNVPVVEQKPPPVPKHIHVRQMTEREEQILCGPVPLSPPCKMRSLLDPQQKIQVTESSSFADDLWKRVTALHADLCSHPIVKYFFAAKPDTKIRFLIRNAQPIVWATQSLSELAAKALTEDQFGIVLKDLPVIINTLLQLKVSMEKTGNFQKKLPKRDFDFCMKSALKSAIKRSLYKISIAYSDYLTDLPLSPENLQLMLNFVNFKEC